MSVRRLVVALLLPEAALCATGNAKAGGAGYAMAFDGLDGTSVSHLSLQTTFHIALHCSPLVRPMSTLVAAISKRWAGPPLSEATVEYWVNVLDPHLTQQPVFAYSAYSVGGRFGNGGEPYENANEFGIIHAPSYLRIFRATSSYDFDGQQAVGSTGNWTHVAVTWRANATDDQPQLMYYLNGVQVANKTICAADGCDLGMNIQPGGVIHLGQEADKPWGDFDELQVFLSSHLPFVCEADAACLSSELQAFTGVVDELRVWTAVRSEAEILASYEGAIDLGTDPDASDLSISWKFDAAGLVRGSALVDSSGNGNSGLVGMMDTTEDQLQFSTGRSSQVRSDAADGVQCASP